MMFSRSSCGNKISFTNKFTFVLLLIYFKNSEEKWHRTNLHGTHPIVIVEILFPE